MAHPYSPPETTLMGYSQDPLQSQQDPAHFSTYSILGPSHYPESVAFWHTPSPVQQQQQPQPTGFPTPVTPYLSQNQQRSLPLQQAPDQKKHKRTRSGCYTCRSRRIKCDEGSPVCDRCRKGNRDCNYPSSSGSSSKSGVRSRSKSKGPGGSRSQKLDCSPDQVEQDDSHSLDPIADDEEEEDEGRSIRSGSRLSPSTGTAKSRSGLRKRQSSTQSLAMKFRQPVEVLSSSPSTEASSRFESMSTRSGSVGYFSQESSGSPGTAHLSEDMRFYLIFHQEVLTFRHYLLRHSNDYFVRQTITELALQYEPLLYAVVGLAAYHHSVQSGNGKLSFLKYYNKALVLLRESLGSGEKHSVGTLVTVLVLTTFEEFSGDWGSLISHHQAAHALMRELLTPQSINFDEQHSNIFLWYARFDVVAGILAGNEAVLSREWYTAKEEYDAQQAALHPHDLHKQIVLASSINRRFGLDMASLYAKLSRGIITLDDFVIQNESLSQTLERINDILVALETPEHTIQSYPHKKPLTEEDPFDPYIPGGLRQGPLWQVNFAWIDYLATKTMFQYQSFLTLQQPPMSELENLAIDQCRLVEAIDRWPEKENGYFLAFNNCLGIASLFLPKDHKHILWCRRKFVQMEQNGYVTPPRYRAAMAAQWQMPDLNHWWLPNDEGYPQIVREIRALTEERMNNPRDDFRESVRDMKTLFWKINLDDTESDKSSPSTLSGGP